MIEIREAASAEDFKTVGHFYLAFKAWLKKTYPELIPIAGQFFNQLEAEIESFPGIYAPPRGSLLLARYDGLPAGTVGLADLGHNQCEMRRMFVDSQFRGAKIGRALGEAIIAQAREREYDTMSLETMPRQVAALGLYRSLGFKETEQPADAIDLPAGLPDDLKRGVIRMELDL